MFLCCSLYVDFILRINTIILISEGDKVAAKYTRALSYLFWLSLRLIGLKTICRRTFSLFLFFSCWELELWCFSFDISNLSPPLHLHTSLLPPPLLHSFEVLLSFSVPLLPPPTSIRVNHKRPFSLSLLVKRPLSLSSSV